MLTLVELFWLTWHAEHGDAKTARMARALRMLSDGRPPAEVAAELKLSLKAVSGLEARFDQERLSLFPRPALFVDEVLEAAHVDLAHARQVAEHAQRLFDLTQPVHNLPPGLQPLLETAALLHNVGMELEADKHHTAGRDLLRAATLIGHSEAEQVMLACLVRFHRKAVRAHKEPLFDVLTPRHQAQTLALAALLRVADGLDYSQSQTTTIVKGGVDGQAVTLYLAGPHSEADGERAREKADLWSELFSRALAIGVQAPDVAARAEMALTAETPAALVAVRALADQHVRWLAAQAEAQTGGAPAIKALRAAARRARVALELFQPYFKKKAHKALRRSVRRAEEALAPVRDWDVLIEQAEKEAADSQWSFLESWRRERESALQDARRWLAGAQVAELTAELEAFVVEPPTKRKAEAPLAKAAESILAGPLEALEAYGAALDEADLTTYHDLRRLAVKRCRFVVEFLAPAIGPKAQPLLRELIAVQDRLGQLNDACVAHERLQAWLDRQPDDTIARRYKLTVEARIRKHLHKFPQDWDPVRPPALRARLDALLRELRALPEGALEVEADDEPV